MIPKSGYFKITDSEDFNFTNSDLEFEFKMNFSEETQKKLSEVSSKELYKEGWNAQTTDRTEL